MPLISFQIVGCEYHQHQWLDCSLFNALGCSVPLDGHINLQPQEDGCWANTPKLISLCRLSPILDIQVATEAALSFVHS